MARPQTFELPDLEQATFVAEGLSFLPPTLTAEYAPRRGATRAALTEILLADLGDQTSKTPHLIVSHQLRSTAAFSHNTGTDLDG